MMFNLNLIFVYGLLTFSISADTTPIPTVSEETARSDASNPLMVFQTMEIIDKTTSPDDYNSKEENAKGQTLQVASKPKLSQLGDFESEHENVARDVDDYFLENPEEGLYAPELKDYKGDKYRGNMAFLFSDGQVGTPANLKNSKSLKMPFLFGDRDKDIKEYVKDDSVEKKLFLFDNKFSDNSPSSKLFGNGKKGQKTQFLFGDDIETLNKINLSNSSMPFWSPNARKGLSFE